MEHYVRPADAGSPEPLASGKREPLHQRLARWLSAVVADRPHSGQSPNLIRNWDGTGTVISGSHGGGGGA
ncbi:hypothetical protein [Krasilnikovia sp. MM14-A1259]|uniref:hypothetical protein n=1 Tax=Krasilnikovia sp. MM14-A1259 TaxID=3373539 RepID=UPI00399C5CCA